MGLLLEAAEAAGPFAWRWLLRDEESGNPRADHPVRLEADAPGLLRFSDLYEYTRAYAVPDRWIEDGTRFARLAGEWAGRELLGDSIGAAILAEAPVTVRVTVPSVLERVLLWPFELAYVNGSPLAAQGDVTFVYDITPGAPARRQAEVGETLRMLAVFSQPSQTSVLALRRERHALNRLIREVAARERARIHLQVVQYGVTRDRLAEIADHGEGWDVLHISGHGTGGVLLLEHENGTPDRVHVDDLVRLLRPARRRLKLAVVSACESAANTTAQTLRLLGLTDQAEQVEATEAEAAAASELAAGPTAVGADSAGTNTTGVAGADPACTDVAGPDAAGSGTRGPGVGAEHRAAAEVPGLAQALVRELDCAVVAMRYPVADEFAIAYGDAFYRHLFGRRQTADLAAAKALAEVVGQQPTAARPPLSIATPGVFGARSIGLAIRVPRGEPDIDPAKQRMAYFPAEPTRFVGRAASMAQASTALAPSSGRTAVLLHGMAGAGKTACALELAYRHTENFAACTWWQAPTRDEEWVNALADFANRLDIQLADYGFTMASHIGTVAALDNFLPQLRAAMEANGVLLVLDNLETLLTADGNWRDDRWAKLITALTDHDGESRLILTARTPPATLTQGPPSSRVVTLPVHSLSLAESSALARELPHLRALLHAEVGPVRADEDPDASPRAEEARKLAADDRDRVRRVLHVVQGHPKLMELADAAAVDRTRLDAQLKTAEDAAAGQALGAFFRDGASTLGQDDFLASLTGWTLQALQVLSPEARLMAGFLACLEDTDRASFIVEASWAGLWKGLERPGEPPGPAPLLRALAAAALVEAEVAAPAEPAGLAAAGPGSGPSSVTYRVHPGVAAAVVAAAGPGVRAAADAELAGFWRAVFDGARRREDGEDSALVVRAGLAAAPYLLRRQDWDTAGFLLQQAAIRDGSPGLTQAVLPPLRRIAAATGAPAATGRLAGVLARVDPAEAERLLRGALDAAAAAGDYQVASGITGDLVNLLRDAGRLAEALAVAGQKPGYTRRAGLGPWTQLLDEARRLQVLGRTGDHARVLAEVDSLRAAMAALPARPGPDEAVEPWNVREVILDTAHTSALATGEWARCLELNAEIAASMRDRGAGVHEVTRFRFNDAGPLRRLGRLGEAGRLLAECQRVFEDHADTARLARVLSARANLEDRAGRPGAAADLARAALRLSYAQPEIRGIAICHHNLASFLGRPGGDREGQRAHRLAAALIFRLTGMARDLADTVGVLAGELREDGGADPSLPSTLAEVVEVAERAEGVRLAALLTDLQPDPQAVELALSDILRTAAEPPPEPSAPDIKTLMDQWEPVIAAVAATCQVGQAPPPELTGSLDRHANSPDWSALVAVLRRILAGERDEPALLTGLDEIDTAIARETLTRIPNPANPPLPPARNSNDPPTVAAS